LLISSQSIRADSADKLIKMGDVCDVKLQATEALKYYLPAKLEHPKDATLCVSIARQYRHLMSDATTRDEKLRLGSIALDYAHRAATLGPGDSEAQLSVAITYGKLLPFLGSKQQVKDSPLIKEAVDKAIKLDPRNDTAWHVLGRWNRVLAGLSPIKRALAPLLYGKLPTATNESAVACFQKAIEINPNRLMHYIELGLTYAQMGRQNEARRYLTKGLSLQGAEKDDPETKQHGRDALAKLR
jgi:Flp pilus assembly protein TadD